MEKWQEKLLLIPFTWHGEEDPDEEGEGDGCSSKSGDNTDKTKPSEKDKKEPQKKTEDPEPDGKDDPSIDDEIDSLSAQELRELLRSQNKELKKTKEVARKRLREIMEKKEKFKEIEAEKDAARQKELEEKEEYKKLYEELKPKLDVLTKDVGKTHTYFEKRFERLKEGLPEEYHGLIPDVDIRARIDWIETFQKTVLAKKEKEKKPELKKNKSNTPVGDKGNPPENPDKEKEGSKSTIEAQINNCKNPEELERLLAGLAKRGM